MELEKLAGLFYADPNELGIFRNVVAAEVPEPFRSLLNHDLHMTVSMEEYCRMPVELLVLRNNRQSTWYSREICLQTQQDQKIVQYGIVRMNLNYLDQAVLADIESQSKPLGRILIEHNVMRRVQLLGLYEIHPSERLASYLLQSAEERCYGRTAMIFCNHEPAIELLEIVSSQLSANRVSDRQNG